MDWFEAAVARCKEEAEQMNEEREEQRGRTRFHKTLKLGDKEISEPVDPPPGTLALLQSIADQNAKVIECNMRLIDLLTTD